MALGDGIRRDVALISEEERNRFRDAFLALDTTKFYPDGVSYWDKEEDIHKNAHAAGADVHGGPAFLPWHRELCNRLEALLREVDPELSLHYWDWTTDPRSTAGGRANLFTPQFMGNANGDIGTPFPNFESTEGGGHTLVWRDLIAGAPAITSDHDIITAGDGSPQQDQYNAMLNAMQIAHGYAHSSYIGGTIAQEHYSFHDPFVFLLHSNVDRLWAMWQTAPGQGWRLDPNLTYGSAGSAPSINSAVQPWAGDVGTGFTPLRPWGPPENQQVVKTYKDISLVAPPCYDTLPTTVHVVVAETPGGVIRFNDVPVGETAIRAAVFELFACDDVTLHVSVAPAAPYAVLIPPGTVTVHHTAHLAQQARLWFAFTGTTAGTNAAAGAVTIHCDQTGQDFHFTLQANTIARPTVGVMLVLDQSGSMGWPAGTGDTRINVLHESAARFVELVQAHNGVGMVRFDNNAYPGVPVTTFGASSFDPNRVATLAAIQAVSPNGATSIGNGIALGRSTLNAVSGFDQKAMIVFTDGLENTPQYIADVMGLIDHRTFAIGLGTTQQVSTGALTALTNTTGGYVLISGPLTSNIDDYFRLSKYFLQILSAVTNTNVVVDPSGYITPGERLRIPFVVSDTDIDVTVILLTDVPAPYFEVETPGGDIMTPGMAASAGAVFAVGTNMSYVRFTLPLVVNGTEVRSGTWYAILGDGREQAPGRGQEQGGALASRRGVVRYSVNVHAFSNLRMDARLGQDSLAPGASMTVHVSLSEYGVPVAHRATVRVQVERPDHSTMTLTMPEVADGVLDVGVVATIAGVYRFHVVATGATFRGLPFTREQLLTGTAVIHGDGPFPTSGPDTQARDEQLCALLECLVSGETLGRFFAKEGINGAALLACVRAPVLCRADGATDTGATGGT